MNKKDRLRKLKNLRDLRKNAKPKLISYFIMLVLYITVSFIVTRAAHSEDVIMAFGSVIPISIFTGVLTSFANICLIFMVVFLEKPGFIIAFVLLLLQMPILLARFLMGHDPSVIPGVFTNLFTLMTIILIYRRNKKIAEYQEAEVEYLKKQHEASQRLFVQTASALVNSIDAKDTYSHGHSIRVAEYAEKIADSLGKDEEERRRIYYAGLLHDVGKLGIPNSIINKKGKLTKEEYEVIKQHPDKGNSILSSITEYPYLSIGAHYHHERYDGKGYPDGLKGEDIPEIARIISVADAYDAMSSNRSYRNATPQQLVREEIVKGAGTQFDPEIAMVMQALIDTDPEYDMREKTSVDELAGRSELYCGEFREEVSEGIVVTQEITRIRFEAEDWESEEEKPKDPSQAVKQASYGKKGRGVAIILFDSLDGRIHDDEKIREDLCYYEYCEIWLDGETFNRGVRRIKEESVAETDEGEAQEAAPPVSYTIEAVKVKDHVLIRIEGGKRPREITLALPDSSRYAFISLAGENCHISEVTIAKEDSPVPDIFIERIVEEISYISGPSGDIPNVQIDGQRSAASKGIPIGERLELSFHSASLPTARLIWHCPYLVIFSSEDGMVNGENYREYALIRFDGESCDSHEISDNRLIVNKNDSFIGWDKWKEKNKEGFYSKVSFLAEGNKITATTENHGISIKNITTILDGTKDIYVAITGDQCAITDIKIEK